MQPSDPTVESENVYGLAVLAEVTATKARSLKERFVKQRILTNRYKEDGISWKGHRLLQDG